MPVDTLARLKLPKRAFVILLAGGFAATCLAQESAGNFPAKPVTIILATSGPGSVDTEYRLYAQAIREQSGPQFVLDYRGGGGGAIGMTYVTKAAPDGYTLLGAVSSLITVPIVNEMRAIGVTGPVRSRLMPEVPTIAEQGVPGYEFSSWLGLLAPAKVSPQVIAKINALFKSASKNPALIKKMDEEDILMVNSTPQEFRDFIVAENQRWSKVIKDAGITVEK